MVLRLRIIVMALLVAVAALFTASLPAALAQEPTPATSDSANFIFVNYIGQDMTFDLDDVTYTIPGTNTAPDGGQLMLTLSPGLHKYAANIPGVRGSAGEFTLEPGQTVTKAARFEQTAPVVEEGELVKKPEEYVFVFDFDPTAQPEQPAPAADVWQPSPAAPGQSSLVWINYTGDELTIDLDGQLYKVAPKSGETPGRLQFDVAPGEYTYTASIPFGSTNGKIIAVAGQVTALDVSAELPAPQDFDIGEEFELTPEITLKVFSEDVTAQATQSTATPALVDDTVTTTPATADETMVAIDKTVVASDPVTATAQTGLRLTNYTGDTLTFTINGQAYSVLGNGELTLDLPPGSYNYTASLPFVAANGTAVLTEEQGVELSVAVNVARDVMNIYQN